MSAVVTCKVTADVLLIKSILKEADSNPANVSLLGDKRVLVSFDSKDKLDYFLSKLETLHDFFTSMIDWNVNSQGVKHFLWVNISGIPLQFWGLDPVQ